MQKNVFFLPYVKYYGMNKAHFHMWKWRQIILNRLFQMVIVKLSFRILGLFIFNAYFWCAILSAFRVVRALPWSTWLGGSQHHGVAQMRHKLFYPCPPTLPPTISPPPFLISPSQRNYLSCLREIFSFLPISYFLMYFKNMIHL